MWLLTDKVHIIDSSSFWFLHNSIIMCFLTVFPMCDPNTFVCDTDTIHVNNFIYDNKKDFNSNIKFYFMFRFTIRSGTAIRWLTTSWLKLGSISSRTSKGRRRNAICSAERRKRTKSCRETSISTSNPVTIWPLYKMWYEVYGVRNGEGCEKQGTFL